MRGVQSTVVTDCLGTSSPARPRAQRLGRDLIRRSAARFKVSEGVHQLRAGRVDRGAGAAAAKRGTRQNAFYEQATSDCGRIVTLWRRVTSSRADSGGP